MSLKSKLWFIYRWLIWIKDNILDNPNINSEINSFSIWKTVLWNDIKCYKFWKWEEKILYFGWIHGNEVWTVKLMNKWVNCIFEDAQIQNKQLFVIPCLNIDWYERALKNPDYFNGWTIWKTNSNNVDLNRNFPTINWSAKSQLFVAWKYSDISWWESAWSEPEIKALLELISKEDIKTIYTFHNCWWTVFSLNADKKVLEYSKKSNYKIFTKQSWETELIPEQKTWHSMEWGPENNIEIIEIELKTRYWSEWKQNKSALINSLSIKNND